MIVLDSNIIIYLQQGKLANPLPKAHYAVSFITQMELFSFPNLSEFEKQTLHDLFSQLDVIGLTESLKWQAVELRRKYRLRLPDALVVATALTHDLLLLSNDLQLQRVATLKLQTVQLSEP